MKIAVVTGIDKPATLESKGGIEVWTTEFCLEEAARGREIDLYGVRGSISGEHITLIETLPKALPEFYNETYFTDKPEEFVKRKEQFMATVYTNILLKLQEKQNSYDLIIDSCSYPSFSFNTHFLHKPVLQIGHFPVDFATKFYIDTFGMPQNNYFVFISQYQLQQASFIPNDKKTVIPNGILLKDFQFNPKGSNSMVWNSRVHKRIDKGIEQAMMLANDLKIPLHATGYVEKSSEEYFQNELKPLLSEYVGFNRQELGQHIDKNAIFGNAKLFLFPIQWEEPFGLVMIEAMACGTPVVAFARGAVPEIIKDGQTGFIVNSSADDIRGDWRIKKTGIEGLKEAVQKVYALSEQEYLEMRSNCRKHAEENFTVQKMVDHYEALFKKIIPV